MADVGHGAARRAAETYRAAVDAKDVALLETIFGPDVVLQVPAALTPENPSGTFHGRERAMGFFRHVSFPDQAALEYAHAYEDGASCVGELVGRLPERDVEAVDIFSVGADGLVTRMAVHARVV